MALPPDVIRIQICNSHRPKIHGGGCCNDKDSAQLQEAFESAIAARQLGQRVEITESACLRNCLLGISLRILPDMITYGRVKIQDIEEIIEQHLIGGQPVARLIVPKPSPTDLF